ncbi:hypothetical protein [Permianibacter aggregans]|uniref:Uncharacterized protein n=1 Tax=Permianibacter aggregans TaxID=1510150 RepID=A0A4R6UDM9_9GAMM|nr:hypothetical protein [Permianibacter aggregans]QGX39678.1 hypothetical protein E2H98_08430 [Permianibacter aggregans]TDQ43209.1 hypothetical protein EV696_1317 [Permianibacter aggregans]
MKGEKDSSAKVISRMIVGLLGMGLLVLMIPTLIQHPTIESVYATAMIALLFLGYACGFEQKMLRLLKK